MWLGIVIPKPPTPGVSSPPAREKQPFWAVQRREVHQGPALSQRRRSSRGRNRDAPAGGDAGQRGQQSLRVRRWMPPWWSSWTARQ